MAWMPLAPCTTPQVWSDPDDEANAVRLRDEMRFDGTTGRTGRRKFFSNSSIVTPQDQGWWVTWDRHIRGSAGLSAPSRQFQTDRVYQSPSITIYNLHPPQQRGSRSPRATTHSNKPVDDLILCYFYFFQLQVTNPHLILGNTERVDSY